jgi:hypothetical protein
MTRGFQSTITEMIEPSYKQPSSVLKIERGFRQDKAMFRVAWALLVCSLAIVLYVRLRLLECPLERDEGEYAYAGQLILDGTPPYKLAYNMKMPGTYLAYAATMAVFGQTPVGIHLGLLAVNLVSVLVLFLIARNFLSFPGASMAACTHALMTLSPVYCGLAAHATHFVVLPALLGIWMLLRFEKSRHWRDSLASGLFFGTAFLMKQPGMLFGVFGGLYLMWLCFRRSAVSIPSSQGRPGTLRLMWLCGFCLGCATPILAVCAWLKIAGVFSQFWFWTVSYAREYASIFTLAEGWPYLRSMVLSTFLANTLLFLAGVTGVMLLCITRMEVNRRLLFAGLLGFSVMAVCPGNYFRPHYFIVLIPAVALLIGFVVDWCAAWFEPVLFLRLLPLLLGALACGQGLLVFRSVLFTLSPTEACRAIYPGKPFVESAEIASYIKRNSDLNARVAVIGSEPEIYFYAQRLSSTGYIYMYPLTEPQMFARRMQSEMFREIERTPPAYLVVVALENSLCSMHCRENQSRRELLEWTSRYVTANMQLIRLIQLKDRQATEIIKADPAGTAISDMGSYIAVFKRRELEVLPAVNEASD